MSKWYEFAGTGEDWAISAGNFVFALAYYAGVRFLFRETEAVAFVVAAVYYLLKEQQWQLQKKIAGPKP